MGATRQQKEEYFVKLRDLIAKYRACIQPSYMLSKIKLN